MSDFDIDFAAELAGIRGHKAVKKASSENKTSEQALASSKKARHDQEVPAKSAGNRGANTQVLRQDAQAPREKPDVNTESEPTVMQPERGESAPASKPITPAQNPDEKIESVDWKAFKTIPGVFVRKDPYGERPVQLVDEIKRSQVSGLIEPLFAFIQDHLKAKYVGASLRFPWGVFKITDRNRVFTIKASLLRYLMFDSLRDDAGTHVLYAKQWLAWHHPAFTEEFKPEVHLSYANDELDIYALLAVAHRMRQLEQIERKQSRVRPVASQLNYDVMDQISMINAGVTRLLDKLNQQEKRLYAQSERSLMTETVLLLDRMGLLKGGLPHDTGEFVRLLEQNRDMLRETSDVLDQHIRAEKEREKRLLRERRMLERTKRK